MAEDENPTPEEETAESPPAPETGEAESGADDKDMAAALAEIEQEEQAKAEPAEAESQPAELRTASDLAAVYDVPVQVSAVLGKANMQVSQLLKLGRGAVVELDRKVGEAIDIYVNNRLVARGEVVVVDERLGVTMTEIIKADQAT
jgi:flagellar motor switch protein FliN/FliY